MLPIPSHDLGNYLVRNQENGKNRSILIVRKPAACNSQSSHVPFPP